MEDCIFCKIASGEIPATKIYENDVALSFLDLHPVSPGHTLIIPKKHYENLLTVPENDLKDIMSAVQKTAKAVMKGMQVEGFNLAQNNGAVSGQAIFHLHFHIIPRKEDDGLEHWPHKDYSDGEEKEISEKIKSNL